MKSFQSFRLDTANQCLWRGEGRIPIPPKAFELLSYLVENPGRVVSQDELLEKLWPDTYVNAEVVRKYIRDVRKILGDRPEKPEFIETLTKRGYRFIASVTDENEATPSGVATEKEVGAETIPSDEDRLSPMRYLSMVAIIPSLAVVALAATVGHFWFARSRVSRPSLSTNSVAVLPFADMSPGKNQEYFSDGLTEELINDLAKVSGLKVVGRASAFQFKGKNQDLREVGRKLGVANVLEGSVRREGNRVRITTELTKADDGFQIWSQSYDREFKDIFAVQDEIARASTEALRLKLLGGNGQLVAPNSRGTSPEAYQAYLQASYFLGRGQGKEEVGKALAYADQAIKLDEKYAPAWAARASAQNIMADAGLTDVTEGFRKAHDDAERAIALDPTSAAGYLALARTQLDYDWDWNEAETTIAKAAALEPGSVEVLRIGSYRPMILGNLDEAIKLEELVIAFDPLHAASHLWLGHLLYMAGRYNEAQVALQQALDLNPQSAATHTVLCRVLVAKGKPQQALVEIEKEPTDWEKLTGKAMAYHALGREQDSNAAVAHLIAKYRASSAYQIAQVYAYRGESDKSFTWLEQAYKQRDAGLTQIKIDPLFKNLRHDPRYAELLKEMHLPI